MSSRSLLESHPAVVYEDSDSSDDSEQAAEDVMPTDSRASEILEKGCCPFCGSEEEFMKQVNFLEAATAQAQQDALAEAAYSKHLQSEHKMLQAQFEELIQRQERLNRLMKKNLGNSVGFGTRME
uniref:E3 ubiquitin-protein ligase RFWD3 n=1 Tax=Haemonchus contortus TaxID=6289 RepID=A0A7I4YV70_HAECO